MRASAIVLSSLLLLLVLPLDLDTGAAWARPQRVRAASATPDEIHWTILGSGAVAFDWRGGKGVLHYGRASASEATIQAGPPDPVPTSSPGPFWEAQVTGLEPGVVYRYAIDDGPERVFTAPPIPGSSDFTVAVEADIGDSAIYPRAGAIQSMIASQAPDFVLAPGDLTYAEAHGPASADRHFNDVMAWSLSAAYMPAWGNHEWEDPPNDDLRNYKGRFALPNAAASPGSPQVSCCGEDWYWFDYGHTRFIAYPEPWLGAWADWLGRARGVMDDAQADPAITFIVTFGHRPAYSSGHHPGSARLASYLGQLAASHDKYVLNLNGHSHDYERTYALDGIVHITSGNGGASLESEDGDCLWLGGCPAPAWSAVRAMHHGFVLLRFGKDAIEGREICGPPGDRGPNRTDVVCDPGSVLDSFRIRAQGRDAAPILDAPARAEGDAGQAFEIRVEAADPDGDSIDALRADLSQLPAGSDAAFTTNADRTRGVLTWTPGPADGGEYRVVFRAGNTLLGSAATTLAVRAPNRPPVVRLAVRPRAGTAPLDVEVDASASSDPDGSIRSYVFEFGDGWPAIEQSGPVAAHTFAEGGWEITVKALDESGAAGSDTERVLVYPVNFVGNPSFEESMDGWNAKNDATLSLAEGGYDGRSSLRVQGPPGRGTFGVNDSPNWVRSVPQEGTRYTFTAWVRSDAARGQVELRVREYFGAQIVGAVRRSAPVDLSPDWQRLELEVAAGAEGSTLDFQIFDRPDRPGEDFQVDGIAIAAQPPESSSGPRSFQSRDTGGH